MQFKKRVTEEMESVKIFRLITLAYEEIAVMKMRKIRKSVLTTREYLSRLSEVFFDVKRASEKKKKEEEMAAKSQIQTTSVKIRPQTQIPLNKTVSVFVSANTSLYGDLIPRIFHLFMERTSKDDSDIIIIGRFGRRLYDEEPMPPGSQGGKKKYLYFELSDTEINLQDLKPVIFHLVNYKKIIVYYGKFESMIRQIPTVSNVSGDQPFAVEKTGEESLGRDFLFEPSLETLTTFFQDLIAGSLFRQTIYETQLARMASRVLAMENAQKNIQTQIKHLKFLEIKLRRQDEQNKQLNRLSGIRLWRR